ncbi:2'-5'-oligoadenylate synthase-like protein 1 [Dromiciops gliroides]|uniref:2'-5'-oligoadenylate synthase-like protein 1 n=1 Tax=Dromiciops gliroides TaxID=33562 RepID=UPI001CC3CBEB|nr:2'-5'-oligoadenylate synthase-like protein 1 [Dromiciops gliroides]
MESPLSLFDVPAEKLDAFIAHELLPTKEFKEGVHDVFQEIQRLFHGWYLKAPEARVLKVIKAGSVMDGTMLNYKKEVQVVVFLDYYSPRTEASLHLDTLMLMKKSLLDHCWNDLDYSISEIYVDPEVPSSLIFTIQSTMTSEPIDVVILTAYNALESSHRTRPSEIYVDLIRTDGLPGQFSPYFIQLRKSFMRCLPVKLKNLLRLLKHWYLQHLKFSCPKASLPPMYALELLTIYAWETGTHQAKNFKMARGFVSVLEFLRDHKDICIYWTKYYSLQKQVIRDFVKEQLERKRPVILDPVDPTHNVGEGKRWDLVAQRAAQCLKHICCFDKYNRPIKAWRMEKVRSIQVTVKKQKGEHLTIWVDPFSRIQQMKKQPKLAPLFYHQQYLFYQEELGSCQHILRCHCSLADYGIFSDVSIFLSERVNLEIHFHVKLPRCRILDDYVMQSNDIIRKLKCMIEEKRGLFLGEYILMFQGQKLKMNFSLGYYDIQEGDILVLSEREHL